MINICCYCNPNYKNTKRIQSVNKTIDLVSQFIILYKSIKKNWNSFDYDITLFYNINIKWSEYDLERIEKLKSLNIIGVNEPDFYSVPWQTRVPCFIHPLKKKGTHRIVLDCDMIAVNNIKLDLSCDWQAMYAGSYSLDKKLYNYIIEKYKYKDIITNNYNIKKNLWIEYNIKKKNYKNIIPYFNAGIIIIKEELCNKLINLWKPSLELVLKKNWNNIIVSDIVCHIIIQYTLSFSLLTLSDNWKPFETGINYLLKLYDTNKFGKENISLLHYCGIGSGKIVKKNFPNFFK